MANAEVAERVLNDKVTEKLEPDLVTTRRKSAEETVRRLTIGDRALLGEIAELNQAGGPILRLEPRAEALVRLAALIALDATETSYREACDQAFLAGATFEDLVATLVAVAGPVGSARVVAAAPLVALATGWDVDAALECHDAPLGGSG